MPKRLLITQNTFIYRKLKAYVLDENGIKDRMDIRFGNGNKIYLFFNF